MTTSPVPPPPTVPTVQGRVELDRYVTPQGYLLPLLRRHPIRGRVLEPAAGDGAIALALLSYGLPGANLVTCDIVPHPLVDNVQDMTVEANWLALGRFDWVVMNAPFFAQAFFVEMAHRIATNVIWLARLSYVEPTIDREAHLLSMPPERALVLPRYKFRPDKKSTDSVTCAWFMRGPAIRPGLEVVTRAEFKECQTR